MPSETRATNNMAKRSVTIQVGRKNRVAGRSHLSEEFPKPYSAPPNQPDRGKDPRRHYRQPFDL